jgi:hypothetical protein
MPKSLSELTVDIWGPKYWKLLHVLASRVGTGDEIMDGDIANGFTFMISGLPDALPCNECKSHARTYLFENRFKPQGLIGTALRNYIEKWLLDFHNSVRVRKGQPILIDNVEMYHTLWSPQKFLTCDDEEMKLYFDYGRTYGIITPTNLTKWLNQVKRLRLILGI